MADAKLSEKDIFEKVPVRKAILALAVPTVISQLIVLIYNLADTWFIGQTGDPRQVAAVTVSYPLFLLLGGFGNLFGIGGGSMISRLLGREEAENAGKIGTFVIWSSVIATLLYSLVIFGFGRQALSVLGTEGETRGYAEQYLFWTVVVGGIPMVLNQVLANIVRAQGKARTASIGMSVGGVLNVALDPLFIFGLHMNVAGAALATCISNVVSVLYLFGHMIRTRKESMVQLTLVPWRVKLSYMAEVFSVGAPAALQIVLASISNSVMLRLMSGYVEHAISGLGIAQKIEMIPFQIVQGLSSGVLPLIAYNYASGNRKRMDSAVRYSLAAGLAVSVIMFAVVELSAPWLVRFFISDAATIEYGAAFTRMRCLALPFINIEFMLIAVFQGIGGAKQAFILSFFRKGIFDLPLMMFADFLWPMYGLMLVAPVMEFLGGSLAVLLYRKQILADRRIPV